MKSIKKFILKFIIDDYMFEDTYQQETDVNEEYNQIEVIVNPCLFIDNNGLYVNNLNFTNYEIDTIINSYPIYDVNIHYIDSHIIISNQEHLIKIYKYQDFYITIHDYRKLDKIVQEQHENVFSISEYINYNLYTFSNLHSPPLFLLNDIL